MTTRDRFREKIEDLIVVGRLEDIPHAKVAEQILSIELDGKHTIEIVNNEAELPEFKLPSHIGANTVAGYIAREWYEKTQQGMIQANYKKVV